jgi:hypothetical protein
MQAKSLFGKSDWFPMVDFLYLIPPILTLLGPIYAKNIFWKSDWFMMVDFLSLQTLLHIPHWMCSKIQLDI